MSPLADLELPLTHPAVLARPGGWLLLGESCFYGVSHIFLHHDQTHREASEQKSPSTVLTVHVPGPTENRKPTCCLPEGNLRLQVFMLGPGVQPKAEWFARAA